MFASHLLYPEKPHLRTTSLLITITAERLHKRLSINLGSMSICRWGASMGSVGPYLYICGGSDDTSRLDTVEKYDPYNDVWMHSEPMSSSRNGVGVCGGDGKIYAIGKSLFYIKTRRD